MVLGISSSIKATLLECYLGYGHILFTDNWYSSPTLFEFLINNQTGACGTVRENRKGMPKFPNKMKTGECSVFHTENIVAEKWQDKRSVCMLNTVYSHDFIETGKTDRTWGQIIKKPRSIIHYNKNMGLVDKADMQICFLDNTRKTLKWYKKFFFHILDIAILNSHILYNIKTGKHTKLHLIQQLLEEFTPNRVPSKGGRRSADLAPTPLRLTGRHFPSPIPASKSKPQRPCYVCKHSNQQGKLKRKDTRWMCAECEVGLCVHPCFTTFHTIKNF